MNNLCRKSLKVQQTLQKSICKFSVVRYNGKGSMLIWQRFVVWCGVYIYIHIYILYYLIFYGFTPLVFLYIDREIDG